jgi:hypothetical protein
VGASSASCTATPWGLSGRTPRWPQIYTRQAVLVLRYLTQLQAERARNARELAVAATLQRSLLPTLTDLPGVSAAARYLVSGSAAQVGGDWYDLFRLPDGAMGVAIGDVMGHDVAAAAAMGQRHVPVLQRRAPAATRPPPRWPGRTPGPRHPPPDRRPASRTSPPAETPPPPCPRDPCSCCTPTASSRPAPAASTTASTCWRPSSRTSTTTGRPRIPVTRSSRLSSATTPRTTWRCSPSGSTADRRGAARRARR